MGDLDLADFDEYDRNALYISDDIDLSDETVLRTIEDVVASTAGDRRGVEVTVLSQEQWDNAVTRLVPASLRRGVRQHFHILADPRPGGPLLVGPSTLAGLNESSPQITAEVTYALIKAGRPAPPEIFQRGSADLLAAHVAREIGIAFFTNNYPRESCLCIDIIAALQHDHPDFTQLEWLQLLKTSPRQFFIALRRSSFAHTWTALAKANSEITSMLADTVNRTVMMNTLTSPRRRIGDDFVAFTARALQEHLLVSRGRETRAPAAQRERVRA